jgi:signal transduction histidine kinase
MTYPQPQNDEKPKRLIGKLLYSDFAAKVSQLPPFSWIARWVARRVVTQALSHATPQVEVKTHTSGLQGALDSIVRDVVEILGFTGAMVATFDNGEILPVKAFHIDPSVTTTQQIEQWEQQVSDLLGVRISITDPSVARVNIYKPKDQKNLSVQAAHLRRYIISNELFDLLTTEMVPDSARGVIGEIQRELGIQQVITVPFFIESESSSATIGSFSSAANGEAKGEYLGNLFAAKRGQITAEDIKVLSTFGQYVASFILSERRRSQAEIIEKLILDMQKSLTSEEEVLKRIVRGMVNDLGYAAASVATYDPEKDLLPAKQFYVDENLTSIEQIHIWEQQATDMVGKPISVTDPSIAKVSLRRKEDEKNLSVQAAQKEEPISSTELFDLITPIAPDTVRGFIQEIQHELGIHHVLAVPFFLETRREDGELVKELQGNLFAMSRSRTIQGWEIDLLKAFGQQAAVGLRNVNLYQKVQQLYEDTQSLYKKAEDRRKATEIFGKMAFTATASAHAMKNHLGVMKGYLQLLKPLDQDNQTLIATIQKRVGEMIELMENLHEPGKIQSDISVDVNTCIRRAAERTFGIETPWIKLKLSPGLIVSTAPEMLTEAFKVLIKNANEAMSNEDIPEENRLLEIESKLVDHQIEITFQDYGIGIDPENLEHIFEMRYTTKKSGLGFGLFWTKDYIEGLGGDISVQSVEGKGTRFTIHLPLDQQQQPEPLS